MLRKLIYTLIASLIALVLIVPVFVNSREARTGYARNDIRFIWQDGKDISEGKNPYSRIHDSDMKINDKYSTYLPGFFLAVSATCKLGLSQFPEFLTYWRPVSLAILVILGGVVFYAGLEWGLLFAATSGGFIWLSRWTLQVLNSAQIDLLSILILLIGLLLLERNNRSGWVVIGLSLAVKQMALIAMPALLLYELQARGYKSALKAAGLMALIPVLISIPFLFWDFSGYLLSILFSATRNGGSFGPESYDRLLKVSGIPGKAAMLFLIFSVTGFSLTGKLSRYALVALIMGIFVSFNSVLLKQYVAWVVPFVPLALMKLDKKESVTN